MENFYFGYATVHMKTFQKVFYNKGYHNLIRRLVCFLFWSYQQNIRFKAGMVILTNLSFYSPTDYF